MMTSPLLSPVTRVFCLHPPPSCYNSSPPSLHYSNFKLTKPIEDHYYLSIPSQRGRAVEKKLNINRMCRMSRRQSNHTVPFRARKASISLCQSTPPLHTHEHTKTPRHQDADGPQRVQPRAFRRSVRHFASIRRV